MTLDPEAQDRKARPKRQTLCAHCGQYATHQAAGENLCLNHYEKFLEANPQHQPWVLQVRNSIMKAHPEWRRGDDETASAYQRRMFGVARELQRRLVKKWDTKT